MNRKEKIIVIIPAYNEEGKIAIVVSRVKGEAAGSVDEIVVIDDGSVDNTALEAKGKGATVISHDANKGVGAAIRTGIDYALKNKYDIIVIMGGDNQDNPSEVIRIITPITEEGFDYIQGSRWLKDGRAISHPFHRRIGTRCYSFIFSLLVRRWVTDASNGFRAFKSEILNDKRILLKQNWLNRYELEPYLLYKVIRHGFKMKEVGVNKFYPPKKIGYTKMIPFVDWWAIIKPVFLLSLGIKK